MNILLDRRWYWYLFLLCVSTSAAQTPPPAPAPVLTVLESGDMLIGDQNRLTFELATGIQPANAEPVVPDSVQGFELLDRGKWVQLKGKWSREVLFTAWDSGTYYTPTFQFAVVRNGFADTVSADRLPLLVSYPKNKDNLTAPIKGIYKTEFAFEDAIPYLIGIVSILLCGLIWFLVRDKFKKKPVPIVQATELVVTPFAAARAQLLALREKQLWEQGQIKPYHTELTYILRDYLEKRYNIPALESTTDEVLAAMRGTDMSAQLQAKLRQVLQAADLVKFAKVVPADTVHEACYAVAMELILETE